MKLILIAFLNILSIPIFGQQAFKVYDKSKNAYGVFDIQGVQIIPTDFDKIRYVNKSFHCFKEGKEGIISDEGYVLVPIKFDSLLYNSCSKPEMYAAFIQNKWMVFSSEGKELIKPIYDKVSAPMKNKVALKKKNRFFELNIENGALDKISEEEFSNFEMFYKECLDVSLLGGSSSAKLTSQNGLYGHKKNDKWVVRPEYQRLSYTGEFWIGKKSGKLGIISKLGEELTTFEFDKISNLISYAIVTKDGKQGVFSIENRTCIIPIQYDRIAFFE